MKLGKKLSIICGVVLVGILLLASFAQFTVTRNTLLSSARTQAMEKETRLEEAFWQEIRVHRKPEDAGAVERATLKYCFEKADDGTGVLVFREDQISEKELPEFAKDLLNYNPVPENSKLAYMLLGRLQTEGREGDRHYIVTGNKIQLIYTEEFYDIYVVEDITDIYDRMEEMALKYGLIALGAILAGLLVMILVIRKGLEPMEALQKAAGEIADGRYSERVAVTTHDEVGEVGQSFNQMAEAVQAHIEAVTEAAEKQKLFVGAVTHEFKTPLTGILLNADSLQNTYMTEEEREAAISAIENQARWLERMVQKMLKLLTVTRHFTPTTFPASQLMEMVEGSTKGILEAREIKLETEIQDFSIQGDPDLLQSALNNLIDNASKASQPGQTVVLRAENGRITVSDQGCGISEDALPHITDAFYMADKSRSKRRGGVGLGLALVQEIVKVHGAKLTIESTVGKGTAVSIDFPM